MHDKSLSIGRGGSGKIRASMAMLAGMMSAAAPVATVAPSAQTAPGINQTRAPNAPTQSMSQQQTIRAGQVLGFHGGSSDFRMGPQTSLFTFPAWNQRKARKLSRQTGRKIQKRYAR